MTPRRCRPCSRASTRWRAPTTAQSVAAADPMGRLQAHADVSGLPWRRLATIMAPAVPRRRRALNLRASVLLTGGAGVGKRITAIAAGAAVGLPVLAFNCHELVGQNDAATARPCRSSRRRATSRRACCSCGASTRSCRPRARRASRRRTPTLARVIACFRHEVLGTVLDSYREPPPAPEGAAAAEGGAGGTRRRRPGR